MILPTQLDSTPACACTQQGCSQANPPLTAGNHFLFAQASFCPQGPHLPSQAPVSPPFVLKQHFKHHTEGLVGNIPWCENWAPDSFWEGGTVTFQTRCTTRRMLSGAFILDTQESSLTLVECRLLLCFHLTHFLSATPPACSETWISPPLTSKNEQGSSACS